ncbi:MAG: hypothetical protein QNJ53_19265 [Pleurocapsa sp. MO_192.B19]|nr:hypothetical protein [Pleurocapsa sp. MO_192.B19]
MNNLSSQELSEQSMIEAHLQGFGEQVVSLCDRESDCQLSAQDAYQEIRQLWLELKQTQPEIIEYFQEH